MPAARIRRLPKQRRRRTRRKRRRKRERERERERERVRNYKMDIQVWLPRLATLVCWMAVLASVCAAWPLEDSCHNVCHCSPGCDKVPYIKRKEMMTRGAWTGCIQHCGVPCYSFFPLIFLLSLICFLFCYIVKANKTTWRTVASWVARLSPADGGSGRSCAWCQNGSTSAGGPEKMP